MGAVCPLPLGFPRVFFIVFFGWRIAWATTGFLQCFFWCLERGLAPTYLHLNDKKRAAPRLSLTFCISDSVILQGIVYRSTLVRLTLKPFKVF